MELWKCKEYDEYRLAKDNHIIPPGQLQYHVLEKDILELDVASKHASETNPCAGYTFERHTAENLRRLTPDTASGNATTWKLLLVMKHETDGQVCLKGALRNASNGEIALMTSMNCEKSDHYRYGNATIHSHDPDWNICHCSIQAPLLFWEELQNRLTN